MFVVYKRKKILDRIKISNFLIGRKIMLKEVKDFSLFDNFIDEEE